MDTIALVVYVLLLTFTAVILRSTTWKMTEFSVRPNRLPPSSKAKVFMRMGV
jgi:hypothetical protein